MESRFSEDLGTELHQVKSVLRHALAEACGTEIRQANTAELQRFEEVLVVASEAAGRLVEIRQRAREQGAPAGDAASAAAPADERQWGHRIFHDEAGVAWDAFAVYPSADTTAKARLPEPYQHGWLSFDSGEERRRLSPIPDDWHSASDEALARMCARAEAAPRRASGDQPGSAPRER